MLLKATRLCFVRDYTRQRRNFIARQSIVSVKTTVRCIGGCDWFLERPFQAVMFIRTVITNFITCSKSEFHNRIYFKISSTDSHQKFSYRGNQFQNVVNSQRYICGLNAWKQIRMSNAAQQQVTQSVKQSIKNYIEYDCSNSNLINNKKLTATYRLLKHWLKRQTYYL